MSALIEFLRPLGGQGRFLSYLTFSTLAALLAVALRRLTIALASGAGHRPERAPVAVALLAGGRRQALAAALAGLRAEHAVADDARTFTIAGVLPAGAQPLERALFTAIQSGRPYVMHDLLRHPGVRAELRRLEVRLRESGLLISGIARRIAQLWALMPLAALVVMVQANNELTPVARLDLVPAALVALGSAWALRRVSPRTPEAGGVLRELRQRYQHLAPAVSPSWTTYGPNEVAMSIALYGGGALWAADPEYATGAAQGSWRGGSAGPRPRVRPWST